MICSGGCPVRQPICLTGPGCVGHLRLWSRQGRVQRERSCCGSLPVSQDSGVSGFVRSRIQEFPVVSVAPVTMQGLLSLVALRSQADRESFFVILDLNLLFPSIIS